MIRLILDIPIPETCSQCPMCHDSIWCRATKSGPFPEIYGKTIPDEIACESRPEWCPLEEIK